MKQIKTLLNVADAVYRTKLKDIVLKSKQYFDNFLFYFVHEISRFNQADVTS